MKPINSRHIITLVLVMLTVSCFAQKAIDIWDGTPVRACVTLTPFLAPDSCNTGVSVIVCPGGSYFWIAYDTEGTSVAKWLQANDISAFVLKYRVAGTFAFVTHSRYLGGGNKFPYPIQDAQRAIQYVRENADTYHINPDKIGIMGFSAGGHLAMFATERSNCDYLSSLGITPTVSLMPSFCASIYPVVTLSDERYVHKRSRRALMGEKEMNNLALRDSLSLEKNVHSAMPPIFLINCKDDPIVKYQNSELLDSALTANKIPHRYIQYETGGHGFGATDDKGSEECRQWRNRFIEWLIENRFLPLNTQ